MRACRGKGSRVGATAQPATAGRAALAQLVEHLIRNEGVTGSSPVSGTIFTYTLPDEPGHQVFACCASHVGPEGLRQAVEYDQPGVHALLDERATENRCLTPSSKALGTIVRNIHTRVSEC